MLKQMVYLSSSPTLDPSPFIESSLLDIQRKNAALGISGILLFSEGTFLQVLEGPADAVDQLYETIVKDRRHRNIVRLHESIVPERSFPDWSMGWKRIPADHPLAENVRRIGDMQDLSAHASDMNGAIATLARTFYAVNRD